LFVGTKVLMEARRAFFHFFFFFRSSFLCFPPRFFVRVFGMANPFYFFFHTPTLPFAYDFLPSPSLSRLWRAVFSGLNFLTTFVSVLSLYPNSGGVAFFPRFSLFVPTCPLLRPFLTIFGTCAFRRLWVSSPLFRRRPFR